MKRPSSAQRITAVIATAGSGLLKTTLPSERAALFSLPLGGGPGRGSRYGFKISAIHRSTTFFRFAPEYSASIGKIFAGFNTAARLASTATSGWLGTKLILWVANLLCIAGDVAQSINFFPSAGFF